MAALETIADAINQIDSKKESLKKAFDDLQAHSSLLSPSFSLSWSDIDRHFSSLQTSLSHRLRLLESLQPPSEPAERVNSAAARLELRALCVKMDGRGLRKYILDHSDDHVAIKLELSAAIQCAKDPAAMVLDAIEGLDAENASLEKSFDVRRVFVLLLERLVEIEANLKFDVRERAKRVASDWRRVIGFDVRKASEALGFLYFVAAYELGSEFHADELVDYFFLISRFKQATFLYKKIGLGDKVADLIQKLLDSGKVLLSIKFIIEFHVIDQFQPVSILKSYLEDSREAAQRVREEGENSLKAQKEATDKEISALKAVIKVIKEHKLEPEFSEENLEKRVEELELEKEKAKRKRNANPATSQQQPVKQKLNKPQQQQQQQRGKKRPRIGPPNHSNPIAPQRPLAQPLRQPLPRPEGVFPDHPGSYHQVNPYGSVSSGLGVVPYVVDPLPGHYGAAAASTGYSSSAAGPANSHLYSSEPNVNPVYYGRQTGYGGYGLPTQYHPAYYPQ